MTGEWRILRFGMSKMSQKMETVYAQNVRVREFVVTWKPELLNTITASKKQKYLCWLNHWPCAVCALIARLVGPQLTIYILQGPKANSSRNQNINLWKGVFQEMIESRYHAESGLTAAPWGGWKLCWWGFGKAGMSSSNGAMTSLLSVRRYARIIIALPASGFDNQ